MIDEAVERSLDRHGFAQVLIVLGSQAGAVPRGGRRGRPTAMAASVDPTSSGDRLLKHFLDEPAARAATASVPGDIAPAAAPVPEPAAGLSGLRARHFPRLGVAMGYVDRGGLRDLDREASVGDIHDAELQFSLIRPVVARAARPRSKVTWGLRKLGIRELWAEGLTGAGVRVGHLDTGIDGKHEALKNRIAEFLEVDLAGNRLDHRPARDSGDHGTHTAGTICGERVRGLSIGVAPEGELYSGLVIEGGQVLLRVLQGMEWTLEKDVRILNMSLGFRGFTPFFVDVTRRLRQRGVLPVFAIGNEKSGSSRSPGNYPEALSVGAVSRSKRVASFSSSITFDRPEEPNQPNVVAPGVSILSAKPGGGVQSMDGTSMATPHVAGVAALLFQAEPEATVDEVEAAIQNTAIPLKKEKKKVRFGFGLVDPAAALEALRSRQR